MPSPNSGKTGVPPASIQRQGKWNFLRISAWLVSVVLHPLLMVSYAFLLMKFGIRERTLMASHENSSLLLPEILAFTVVIPFLFILLFRLAGWIKSLSMEDSRDRHLPHFATFCIYFSYAILLREQQDTPAILIAVLAGTSLCILLVGFITVFWKISSHMAGIGGFTGFLLGLSLCGSAGYFLFPMVGGILCSCGVAAARYYLKAHNPAQLLAGFFLGMVSSSVSVCFFAELF